MSSDKRRVFRITSCDLLGILYRIYMFHLFIEKNFESKGGREKRNVVGGERRGEDKTNMNCRVNKIM